MGLKPKQGRKEMLKKFLSQRGAMFSMDARIALVIASVLAGVVGTQVVQRIERGRVEAAEAGVQTLMSGLENYYKTVSLNAVPPGNPSTFSTGAGNFDTVIIDTGIVPDSSLATDPWGREWVYETCSAAATIEGVQVLVHYVVLYSGGPNLTNESGTGDFLTNAACAANYSTWNGTADDIGIKFNTFDVERDRVAEMKNKLVTVQSALQAYETTMFLENQGFCSVVGNQGTTPRCDFDGASGYIPGEEISLNYFPRSTNDPNLGGYYYIPNGRIATGNEMSVVNNNAADMTSLMTLIGLSADYIRDPWGRLLCYESNRTDNVRAPFTAKLEYTNTCPTP